MKGVSATYTATYLAINNPGAITYYMQKFQWLPLIYFISITFFSIPLFTNKIKSTKIFDLLGLITCFIITVILFLI
jgi:asparagine N-glycosylation enzyme membrane subunit Stt3